MDIESYEIGYELFIKELPYDENLILKKEWNTKHQPHINKPTRLYYNRAYFLRFYL